MLYVPCQQFLTHAGMISCLSGSNQYQAADKVSAQVHIYTVSLLAASLQLAALLSPV